MAVLKFSPHLRNAPFNYRCSILQMKEFIPAEIYRAEAQKHAATLQRLRKRRNGLGWARGAVVLATIAAAYVAFGNSYLYGWIVIAVGVSLFLFFLNHDINNDNAIANTTRLTGINEEEIKVLNHQFRHRFDGRSYAAPLHPYADDLDVFGTASLYQYINRCHTEQGRNLLAANFLAPLPVEAIKARHEAVKEVAGLLQWRQQFQAHAEETPVTVATQQRVEHWLQHEVSPFRNPAWSWFVPLYSIATIGSAVAAFAGYISTGLFSFLFVLYFFFASNLSRKVMKLYGNLSRIVGEADTLSNLISSLEQQVFTSDYLRSIQTKIQPPAGSAGKELKSLKNILGRFDLRLNTVLFLLLNSFLLWDVRQVKSLTAWKAKNRTLVPLWFSAIEEAEVMISLGILHFNQPHFIFPQFKDEYCLVAGSGIGHPLLHEGQRVTSDFSISGRGKIALITGSNMAGKSTFLRSLGVNLVLAQMGAPVCAQTFTLSPMKLMSSMRIADDLSENTSTFYAELKKLKSIIDEVNRQQPLIILLDEILRGTNSLDRHAGTKALIRQLIKQQTVAVLATHDVALAELSDDHSQAMENYHFDVQVAKEDELYFDYKLKRGVCQSLNAAILMRKIGIELER
ncbi:MAG TPA: hypothetical protein VEY06_01145 [Flavisolibacter sp.]|nr:hypothetical protein [Flavisolibacter sp.]